MADRKKTINQKPKPLEKGTIPYGAVKYVHEQTGWSRNTVSEILRGEGKYVDTTITSVWRSYVNYLTATAKNYAADAKEISKFINH